MPGFHRDGFFRTRAGKVGIDGLPDGVSFLQLFQVVHQQTKFQRPGVVEIYGLALFYRNLAVIFVLGVLGDQHDFAIGKLIDYLSNHGCFSRSGPPGNSHN